MQEDFNKSELENVSMLFTWRIASALDSLEGSDRESHKRFFDDGWHAPLLTALTSIHLNRDAYKAIDLAIYPALPQEPVPILFKKALLMSINNKAFQSDSESDEEIREADKMANPVPLQLNDNVFVQLAENALQRVLNSSVDLEEFLLWFLQRAPSNAKGADRRNRLIRFWKDGEFVAETPLFQPYRYSQQEFLPGLVSEPIPDFLPDGIKAHIEEYERGFMEQAFRLLVGEEEYRDDPSGPTNNELWALENTFDNGDPLDQASAYNEARSKALVIIKAISGWIWLQLNDEEEVKAAFTAHLCNRSELFSHIIGYSEEWDSTSLRLCAASLESVPQLLLLGVQSSGQGYVVSDGEYTPDRILGLDEARFLLSLDYQLGQSGAASQNGYAERLWLDTDLCNQREWDTLKSHISSAINRFCYNHAVTAAKSSDATPPEIKEFLAIKPPSLHGEIGNIPGLRELASKTGRTATLPIVISLDSFPGVQPNLIGLFDRICELSGINIPTMEELYSEIGSDDEWEEPLGISLLWEYEQRAAGSISYHESLSSTRGIKSIGTLIAVGLYEEQDMVRRKEAMGQYPYILSHQGVDFVKPPTENNLFRRLKKTKYVSLAYCSTR